jgi:hypothetical protein
MLFLVSLLACGTNDNDDIEVRLLALEERADEAEADAAELQATTEEQSLRLAELEARPFIRVVTGDSTGTWVYVPVASGEAALGQCNSGPFDPDIVQALTEISGQVRISCDLAAPRWTVWVLPAE